MAEKDRMRAAPADSHLEVMHDANSDRKPLKDGAGDGVQPILANPDQPVFPRPFGVDEETLHESGTAHGYVGVGSVEQQEAAEEQAEATAEVETADAQ